MIGLKQFVKNKYSKFNQGISLKSFTLIELLVVIAIVGLLASIALVSLQGAAASARDGKRDAEVGEPNSVLRKTLEVYHNTNGNYPWNEETEDEDGCCIESDDDIKSALAEYLSANLEDPRYDPDAVDDLDKYCYRYKTINSGEDYKIRVNYETGGYKEIASWDGGGIGFSVVSASVIQTSDTDFNGGINTAITVSGTGDSADLILDGSIVEKDVWDTSPANTLGTVYRGSQVLSSSENSDHLYLVEGDGSTNFYRYSISENNWENMAATPNTQGYDVSSVYPNSGNYIYTVRTSHQRWFWRYSISDNSWLSMADAPGVCSFGSSLSFSNSANHIYLLAGEYQEFYRYSISDNSWSSMADTPERIRYGASSLYPGIGDHIYVLRGGDTATFWRYSISGNNWAVMTNTPDTVYYGSSLVYPGTGDHIYAFRGGLNDNFVDFWRYSITNNTWETRADTPAGVDFSGGSLVYPGTGDHIYAVRGNNTTDFWRYQFRGEAYYSSGNLESSVLDIENVSLGTLDWNAGTTASTTVKFQIASSADNVTWSSFQGPDGATGTYYTTSGTEIYSGHDGKRYVKYKAFLETTSSEATAYLHDVTVNYNYYP